MLERLLQAMAPLTQEAIMWDQVHTAEEWMKLANEFAYYAYIIYLI